MIDGSEICTGFLNVSEGLVSTFCAILSTGLDLIIGENKILKGEKTGNVLLFSV